MFEIFKYDNYKSKSAINHVTHDTKVLAKLYRGGGKLYLFSVDFLNLIS